jgi:hypothetical protein
MGLETVDRRRVVALAAGLLLALGGCAGADGQTVAGVPVPNMVAPLTGDMSPQQFCVTSYQIDQEYGKINKAALEQHKPFTAESGEQQNAERYTKKAAIAPAAVKPVMAQLADNAQQAATGKITPTDANKKDIPLLMQYLNWTTANCQTPAQH